MRLLRLATFTALLTALAAAPAGAQVLFGRVTDANDGTPVAGARVTALDPSGISAGNAVSGADGGFEIRLPAAGTVRLQVSRVGYRTGLSPTVAVGAGDRTSMDLSLRPDAVQMEALQARARATPPFRDRRARGFYDRMDRGMGQYMTREQIAARGTVHTSDLLRTIPELSFRGGSASTELWFGGNLRGCSPTLYIDGVRKRLDKDQRLNDLVAPADIWAIEVYRYGSDIPPDLPRESVGSTCGAVIIWTLNA